MTGSDLLPASVLNGHDVSRHSPRPSQDAYELSHGRQLEIVMKWLASHGMKEGGGNA
jgi:hypothetical protein